MDCYHWHHMGHIFKSQSGTTRFTSYLLTLHWDTYFRTISQPGLLPSPLPVDLFTCWLFTESDWTSPLIANLLSLYNILNAHTFSFQFPIHTIHFCYPLFTQVHILFRNPQLTCCQRSICNTHTAIWPQLVTGRQFVKEESYRSI